MKLIRYITVLALLYCGTTQADNLLINKNDQGLAIGGYDTVAYFLSNKAIAGIPANSTKWQGATWYFSSTENKDRFISTPEKYAPQFGGYCAYAASLGQLANGDPLAWTIVDQKLYLNFNTRVRDTWRANAREFIGDGNILWPDIVANNKE